MKHRPIKFRAWHTDEFPGEELRETMRPYEQLSIDGCLDGVRYGNIILMQFTGLKTEDGTEIYEGDILCSQYRESGGPMEGHLFSIYNEVAFQDGSFGYIGENTKEFVPFVFDGVTDNVYTGCTVAGNIYQHPQLLQQDDEREENEFSPYRDIPNIKPAFAGNLTNWIEWEAAFMAMMQRNDFAKSHLSLDDWHIIRKEWFNESVPTYTAYKHWFPEFFASEPSILPQ